MAGFVSANAFRKRLYLKANFYVIYIWIIFINSVHGVGKLWYFLREKDYKKYKVQGSISQVTSNESSYWERAAFEVAPLKDCSNKNYSMCWQSDKAKTSKCLKGGQWKMMTKWINSSETIKQNCGSGD